MPFYKDTSNKLHFLDNDSFAYLLPAGCVSITDAEAAAIQKAAQPDPKVAMAERIKAERDRRRQVSGYLVAGKWFHSDDYSKSQQMGLVMLGANLPAVQWKTMDGTFIAMTPALAQQVFAAAVAFDAAVFARCEAHLTAMKAAPDAAAYDFSGGWPAAFAPGS